MHWGTHSYLWIFSSYTHFHVTYIALPHIYAIDKLCRHKIIYTCNPAVHQYKNNFTAKPVPKHYYNRLRLTYGIPCVPYANYLAHGQHTEQKHLTLQPLTTLVSCSPILRLGLCLELTSLLNHDIKLSSPR